MCAALPEKKKKSCISARLLELIAGIEPANLILTKDALYLLSYISTLLHRATDIYYHNSAKKARGKMQIS